MSINFLRENDGKKLHNSKKRLYYFVCQVFYGPSHVSTSGRNHKKGWKTMKESFRAHNGTEEDY